MLWIVDAARASVYLEQKFARMHWDQDMYLLYWYVFVKTWCFTFSAELPDLKNKKNLQPISTILDTTFE